MPAERVPQFNTFYATEIRPFQYNPQQLFLVDCYSRWALHNYPEFLNMARQTMSSVEDISKLYITKRNSYT